MTYERLAYDDADTADHMQHDCEEVVAEMQLPKQTTVATALDAASGLATDVAAGAAQTVRTTVVTVSDTAARLAAKLLPF